MTIIDNGAAPRRKVGFLLGVGIVFLPYIFVWLLLRRGYSLFARIVGFAWLLIMIGIAFGHPGAKPTTGPDGKPVAPAEKAAESKPAEPTSKWVYSDDTDAMRGTKTFYATRLSDDEQKFDFPYKGGKAQLMLRRRPSDGLNVLVTIEGQFICHSDDTVAVKFDSQPIQRYPCSEPSDGSTGVMFINNTKRFVTNLKTAKTVIIEAPFYQEGRRQMTFDVQGLQWPPKDKGAAAKTP